MKIRYTLNAVCGWDKGAIFSLINIYAIFLEIIIYHLIYVYFSRWFAFDWTHTKSLSAIKFLETLYFYRLKNERKGIVYM
jgi:hypothetical protein